MKEHELEHGQAIAFQHGETTLLVMIISKFSAEQEDGATHTVEVLSGGDQLPSQPQAQGSATRKEELRVIVDCVSETVRVIGFGGDEGPVPFTFMGYHLPPLPDHIQHSCTNWRFLAFYVAAVAFQVYITCYAWEHGNMDNFHHAFDYNGNMCGVDVPGKKYVFWCKAPGAHKVNLKYPICVEKCPTSSRFSHVCFDPVTRQNATFPDYSSRRYRISPYCWPTARPLLARAKQMRRERVTMWGKFWMSLPRRAIVVVPLSAVISLLIGLMYFKLLEKCVDFIVVVFILSTTNLSLVFGLYQLLLYSNTEESPHLLYGCCCLLFSLLAFRLFFSGGAQSAISMAAGCIEAACECINQEMQLLFEPLVSFHLRLGILTHLVWVLLLLLTTGAPQVKSDHSIRKTWGYTWEQSFYIGWTVGMLFWMMEMVTSLSQYVLAWVTERWYFTPYVNDVKLDREHNAVCKGYAHALNKHLGSIALGSLLILTFRVPRYFCKIFERATKVAYTTQNPLCMCMADICCLSCNCILTRIRHYTKNAYLGVALTSENFCRAALSVDYMLNYNPDVPAVGWLNGMQGIFQVGGLFVITCASGAGTLVFIQVFNFVGPDIAVRDTVIYLSMIISFPIGLSYMTLFDTVGDTILYCWAVQQRRYNYHADHMRKQYANSDTGVLGGLFQSYFAGGPNADAFSKVNYAPPALRELVLGRHRKLASFPCCAEGYDL